MARRFKLDIYATPLTWRFFSHTGAIGALAASQVKMIEPEKPINIGGVTITAFDIPHDAVQPVGYTFEAGGEKIAVATDFGCATDTIRRHLKGAQIIALESNYDPVMLKNGPYYQALKERVAVGHLSNAEAGVLLAEVASDNLEHVFLAHLSEENNMPMLAYDTVKRVLNGHNVFIKNLYVAERHTPGVVVQYG